MSLLFLCRCFGCLALICLSLFLAHNLGISTEDQTGREGEDVCTVL